MTKETRGEVAYDAYHGVGPADEFADIGGNAQERWDRCAKAVRMDLLQEMVRLDVLWEIDGVDHKLITDEEHQRLLGRSVTLNQITGGLTAIGSPPKELATEREWISSEAVKPMIQTMQSRLDRGLALVRRAIDTLERRVSEHDGFNATANERHDIVCGRLDAAEGAIRCLADGQPTKEQLKRMEREGKPFASIGERLGHLEKRMETVYPALNIANAAGNKAHDAQDRGIQTEVRINRLEHVELPQIWAHIRRLTGLPVTDEERQAYATGDLPPEAHTAKARPVQCDSEYILARLDDDGLRYIKEVTITSPPGEGRTFSETETTRNRSEAMAFELDEAQDFHRYWEAYHPYLKDFPFNVGAQED